MDSFIIYVIIGVFVGFFFGWLFKERGFILFLLSTLSIFGSLVMGYLALYVLGLTLWSYFFAILGACLMVLIGITFLIKQVNKHNN